ncbi:MAG TPA: winged helix-turn-helix transcriptional regulator [Thermoanaerobaculia bacterium]|jgi:hypothetical protein
MDVTLGKRLDAWIGRLIDFAGADPLRRELSLKLEAEPAPPLRVEVPEKKVAARPEKKVAARPEKKAPRKRAARPRPAVAALEEAVRRAEATPSRRAALEAVDRRVLEALAAFADGAAINELAAATGQAAGALRRRLDKLAAAGRVERVAAGLRTRYRRTGG